MIEIYENLMSQQQSSNFYQTNPPSHICDCISLEVFKNPILVKTGNTYEANMLNTIMNENKKDPLNR